MLDATYAGKVSPVAELAWTEQDDIAIAALRHSASQDEDLKTVFQYLGWYGPEAKGVDLNADDVLPAQFVEQPVMVDWQSKLEGVDVCGLGQKYIADVQALTPELRAKLWARRFEPLFKSKNAQPT
jgi:hypothetical protein